MALTTNKRNFATAIREGKNLTDAAIEAGYSEKTASQAGSRLMKDPDVLAEIGRKDVFKQEQAEAKAAGKPFNLTTFAEKYNDPKDFLLHLMNDESEEEKLRVDAAKSLLPYFHAKKGDIGKKGARQERANQAHSKFSEIATAPSLKH